VLFVFEAFQVGHVVSSTLDSTCQVDCAMVSSFFYIKTFGRSNNNLGHCELVTFIKQGLTLVASMDIS